MGAGVTNLEAGVTNFGRHFESIFSHRRVILKSSVRYYCYEGKKGRKVWFASITKVVTSSCQIDERGKNT